MADQKSITEYAPCPKCGGVKAKKIGYTWWGGAVGPKLYNHVKCESCGTAYNGKTGQSNTSNIVIYIIVSTVIVAVICYLLMTTMLNF
jgi:uncharacterized Zn finger protein